MLLRLLQYSRRNERGSRGLVHTPFSGTIRAGRGADAFAAVTGRPGQAEEAVRDRNTLSSAYLMAIQKTEATQMKAEPNKCADESTSLGEAKQEIARLRQRERRELTSLRELANHLPP